MLRTGRSGKRALSLRGWTVLLALSFGLPVAALLTLVVRAEHDRRREAQVGKVAERAEAAMSRVNARLDHGFAVLLSARTQLTADGGGAGALPGIVALLGQQDVVTSLQLATANGLTVLTVTAQGHKGRPSDVAACLPDLREHQRLRSRTRAVSATRRSDDPVPGLTASIRFVEQVEGCSLSATLATRSIGEALRARDWEPGWTASVVDPTLRIVARNSDEQRYLGQHVTASLAASIRQGGRQIFSADTKDNVAVTAYTAPLESAPGWFLAVGAAHSVLDTALPLRSRHLLWCAAVVAAVGVLLILLLVRGLSDAVRDLGQGRLAASRLRVAEIEDARVALVKAREELDVSLEAQARMIDDLLIEAQARRDSESAAKALQAQLLTAQERERAALSRELHDELGQELALLQLHLPRRGRSAGADAAAESHAILQRIVDRVRTISHGLRPPQLEHLGLGPAIQAMLRSIAGASPMRIVSDVPEDLPRLADVTETALYRVCQGAVTNVLRHAHASELRVTLRITPEAATLTVVDDGIGLEPPLGNGMGLVVMRERVLALGGTFSAGPSPAGTRIQAQVPTNPSTEDPPHGW